MLFIPPNSLLLHVLQFFCLLRMAIAQSCQPIKPTHHSSGASQSRTFDSPSPHTSTTKNKNSEVHGVDLPVTPDHLMEGSVINQYVWRLCFYFYPDTDLIRATNKRDSPPWDIESPLALSKPTARKTAGNNSFVAAFHEKSVDTSQMATLPITEVKESSHEKYFEDLYGHRVLYAHISEI